jgi:broad specificity phosphatase PhoE
MRTLTCLRHSKTPSLEEGANDKTSRHLTQEGIDIALRRREALGDPKFDFIIVSSAARTLETANVIAGTEKGAVPIVEIDELYPSGDDMDRAFTKLRYAPYGEYVEDKDGRCVMATGKRMASVAHEALAMQPDKQNILLVGHAVVLTAMVAEMHNGVGNKLANVDEMMDYALNECEGYVLTLNDRDQIVDLKVIRN